MSLADPEPGAAPVEALLRDELARGDAMLGTVAPILRHLILAEHHSLFSEEIVARTRAMLDDAARQLLVARGEAAQADNPHDIDPAQRDALTGALAASAPLLEHVHAAALEWQVTERLHARLGLDPVLSPLLQALIASSDAETAALAMNLLAAQARFTQAQRRMELPLGELPADLLPVALAALREAAGAHADAATTAITARYDESRSRLGLIARLMLGMGGGACAALSISHAGVAMFLSALSLATGQERALVAVSTHEGQVARLAVALAAAGLKPASVEEQLFTLHPELAAPAGLDQLGADGAAALLAHAGGPM